MRLRFLPLLVAVAVAGCGGGSSSTSSTRSSTGSSTGSSAATTGSSPARTASAAPTSGPPATAASSASAPSATPARPKEPKPCEVLTPDLAGQVLPTATLLDGVPSGTGLGEVLSCTYAGDPSKSVAEVELFLGAGAKKSLDIDRDNLQHEFTSVPGLGDEAYAESGNVFVRRGTLWVQLRAVTLELSDEEVAANLVAVAGQVVARL